MSWEDELAPEERASWDRFVQGVREHTVKGIVDSAAVLQIAPPGEPDIRMCVELGLGLYFDKPLVVVAFPGQPIPSRLRRAADHVIELESDLDTEAGRLELDRKLGPVLDHLGIGDDAAT